MEMHLLPLCLKQITETVRVNAENMLVFNNNVSLINNIKQKSSCNAHKIMYVL